MCKLRNSNCLKVFFLYVNDETFLFAIFPVNHQRPFTFSPLVQTILFFILLFNIHISLSDDTRSEREENDVIATLLEKKFSLPTAWAITIKIIHVLTLTLIKSPYKRHPLVIYSMRFIYLCVWNRGTAFYKRTYGQSL